MQYNKDSHINNVDDVIKFFRYIVDERNVNFNPDDMFEDYMSADGTNAFTPEECEIYNHLTKECFDICEKEEADIYEIAFELLNYKNIRKIRMAIKAKGKGKSGGARVITFNVFTDVENGHVVFLLLYDKEDASTVKVNVVKQLVRDMGFDIE